MKKEDMVIQCAYKEEAKPAEELLYESFCLFLNRELSKEAKGRNDSVS